MCFTLSAQEAAKPAQPGSVSQKQVGADAASQAELEKVGDCPRCPLVSQKKKQDTRYFSLDSAERRKVLLHRLTGWQAVYETVPGTMIDQARNFPKSWGRGFDGFGKRIGSQYGQFAAGEGIEFGFAAWRQEDPRYHRKATGGFGGRLGHSLAATFVTNDATGNKTIAGGRLLGIYGSWAVATAAWLAEEERNFRRYTINSSMNVLTKTGANVFREFWHDIKGKLFKKKSPTVPAPAGNTSSATVPAN